MNTVFGDETTNGLVKIYRNFGESYFLYKVKMQTLGASEKSVNPLTLNDLYI
jgi:hypothetical protein